MQHPADAGLRIREAVRGLVTDGQARFLLVRFEFPAGTRWALPGGGIDPGESDIDALRRELGEELGLTDAVIGAPLWDRLHIVPFVNGLYDGQRERIYEVLVPPDFVPQPVFSWEQLNAEFVFELRWWTLTELHALKTITAPAALAALAADYVRNGPPAGPIAIDP